MASGETLVAWDPAALCNVQPTANAASYDERNNHPVLDFDGAAAEVAVLHGVMPKHYAGGGVKVYLWVAVDGTTGDLDWDAEMERRTGLDIDADSFAAAVSTDGTSVSGTSGIPVKITITLTSGAQMDSVVAGDPFRIRLTRQGGDDTNNDDAQLLAVEMEEV